MLKTIFLILAVAIMANGCATKEQRTDQREKDRRLVEVKTQLGVEYLQRGQFEIATQELESALEIDPGDVNANNIMALLQWRLKDYGKAEKHFKRAVRNQHNSEAQNNYGVFLCEQGRIDEALARFNKALSDPLYRTPEQANLNAGMCLMKRPAHQEAARYFRAALRLDPKLSMALYQMARISYETANMVSARGFIQRYFEAGKDTPESLYLAVKIERSLRNKDREASYALRLRGKFPDSPEALELERKSGKRRQ